MTYIFPPTKGLEWLLQNSVATAEGDQLIIKKMGKRVEFYKNGKLYASTKSDKVAELVFIPWLGEKPVDREIKRKLWANSHNDSQH